jgi:hypothetical protein
MNFQIFKCALSVPRQIAGLFPLIVAGLLAGFNCSAQIDPEHRSLLELGYGYGFNAIRDGKEGAHSIGLLFQYNFAARKKTS